ncbi:MAG: cold-shock protein [Flavobacteriaceae bacterium]|nr:cold shock domain-containing protein [Bizionia echini]MBP93939.1 cold-shock protein [Flavobacteriaceae bacterium]|tara:strand:- start:1384 stop:1638 length:255 start_codon:yes stop_codon:yes gene_type:complete
MLKRLINKLMNANKTVATKEGTVKFFNRTKGFGFITSNDSEEEIFVHKSNLIDKIRKSDKVTFQIEKSDRGLIATEVRRIKKNK